MSDTEEIKICTNHQDYKTPLIWTFAFPGAEYWCPVCGQSSGMLGAGINVEATPELKARTEAHLKEARGYLEAIYERTCDSMEYEGKRITFAELPEHEKQRGKEVIDNWNGCTKI